jgi:hypothetical protein
VSADVKASAVVTDSLTPAGVPGPPTMRVGLLACGCAAPALSPKAAQLPYHCGVE